MKLGPLFFITFLNLSSIDAQTLANSPVNTLIYDELSMIVEHPAFTYSLYERQRIISLDDFFSKAKLKQQMIEVATNASSYIPSNFYETVFSVSDPNDYLVLVNKNFYLQPSDTPQDLVLPQVAVWDSEVNTNFYLREEVARQVENMFEEAMLENYELMIRSAYRSYHEQVSVYEDFLSKYGPWYVEAYTAIPGHSEHQTGLAFDITSQSVYFGQYKTFDQSPEYEWVKKNAHRFGFVIRYPEGRENSTGFSPEPWHWRYVGVDVATLLYEKDWILEDYILSIYY
ncbi:MAG TPA: D-alanyl-D-alanine carboxypeptidase [Firmicutes bacterium]|nr:D-alanyl-D-alanine carboxypeptidase [Bacillota bacterium]